jgi:Bacteriophage tail sheath protein
VSVEVSYPGVYIQEAVSGVHPITGVATSITAFVGRTQRGPTNLPVTLNSFSDLQRQFGGLWAQSRLGFSVRDFFLNGGSQAIVVRLFHPDASPQQARLDLGGGVMLDAAGPGTWGNSLSATVDYNTRPFDPSQGETATSLFNLTVSDPSSPPPEVYRNVSLDPANARYLPNVLPAESTLVVAVPPYPASRPPAGTTVVTGAANTASDGLALTSDDFIGAALPPKEGLYALDLADLFNLLVIPPYTGVDDIGNPDDVDTTVITAAASYCESRRAFLLVDSLPAWQQQGTLINAIATADLSSDLGTVSGNAAVFFPRLLEPNPLRGNQIESFATGGAVAGVFARTDAQRKVWKAPAGLAATLNGVKALQRRLTDPENGELNPVGINCLRVMPGAGPVVWGSRTLQGADILTSQWKYVPVRRFALYLEESLYRGTQWVVFEPNDEALWGQIRLNITAFMQGLFEQGAFQGTRPVDAYFVKCDSETTTQADINLGIVNIVVGFAPLKPAEFVVITLQQLAGQATS